MSVQNYFYLDFSDHVVHLSYWPKKIITLNAVKKQLKAEVPFTAIAASQKVSEGTLRRRMREGSINS